MKKIIIKNKNIFREIRNFNHEFRNTSLNQFEDFLKIIF